MGPKQGASRDYGQFLAVIKQQIDASRIRAASSVNQQLHELYWFIGKSITERQEAHGWGDSVIERLSADLKQAYPGMGSFSSRNLRRMRQFYTSYRQVGILATAVAKLGWSSNLPTSEDSMKVMTPLLLLLAGCDMFGTVRPTGRPVSEAYSGTAELRVLDIESPLRAQKRIPLLSTPEVFAVYSTAYADGDIMFGDRFLYLRLRESTWLADRLREPEPPATGDAAPEAMRPVKELDWGRVVVPHRN
jgi:hypothetical protein